MQRLLVASLFIVTAIAGCLADEPAAETAPTPALGVEIPPIPHADAHELLAQMRIFAEGMPERKGNGPDHLASRTWLLEQYGGMFDEVWHQKFTNGIDQENICGIQWGRVRDEWIVVGGHYDMTTTGGAVDQSLSQGMYDDGSGTIMTLRLGHAFREHMFDRTIAWCAFDGEERGLQGSGAVAQALFAEEEGGREAFPTETPWGNVTVKGMVDLDMIGLNWPANQAPIYADNNSPALEAYIKERAAELAIPADMVEYHGIVLGRSDYAHFFAQGVPTVFFISDFDKWTTPSGDPAVPRTNVDCTPVPSPVGIACAYPFWHHADTWQTMLLMAGNDEHALHEGFQVATDLAAGAIWFLAADATQDIAADVK